MEADHILTQRDLDAAMCEHPNCDHSTHEITDDVVLMQQCHDKGVEAHYSKSRGVLTLLCIECDEVICEIKVSAT